MDRKQAESPVLTCSDKVTEPAQSQYEALALGEKECGTSPNHRDAQIGSKGQQAGGRRGLLEVFLG